MTPTTAVRKGMATTLVLALPAAVLNQLLVDDDGPRSPWVLVLWLVILFGAAAGGWAVRHLCPDALLQHSATAALGAYVVVQGIGVARRLLTGGEISWLAFPLLATLMATCGMLGGAFARRTAALEARTGDGTSGGRSDGEGLR